MIGMRWTVRPSNPTRNLTRSKAAPRAVGAPTLVTEQRPVATPDGSSTTPSVAATTVVTRTPTVSPAAVPAPATVPTDASSVFEALPTPTKTYDIAYVSRKARHHAQVVSLGDENIFWAAQTYRRTPFMARMALQLTTESVKGPIVAVSVQKGYYSFRIQVGDNPDAVPFKAWTRFRCESYYKPRYSFLHQGRKIFWVHHVVKLHKPRSILGIRYKKRTGREKSLRFTDSYGRVMASYDGASVFIFEELGRDLELFCLVSLLGMLQMYRAIEEYSGGGSDGPGPWN